VNRPSLFPAQVEQLASRVELERFSPAVVRNLCGGTLLSHLVTHLHLTEAQPGPALLQYSAHYPTLLCLLSALRSNPSGAAPAPDPHVRCPLPCYLNRRCWVHSPSRGGLPGLAGVTTRPAGYPTGGAPPAAERQLHLLTHLGSNSVRTGTTPM
jgi:hypothetical protein